MARMSWPVTASRGEETDNMRESEMGRGNRVGYKKRSSAQSSRKGEATEMKTNPSLVWLT